MSSMRSRTDTIIRITFFVIYKEKTLGIQWRFPKPRHSKLGIDTQRSNIRLIRYLNQNIFLFY